MEYSIHLTSEEEKSFYSVLPDVIAALTDEGMQDKHLNVAYKWFKESLIYSLPPGKKNRGMAVVSSFKKICPNATEAEIRNVKIIGWSLELMHTGYLLLDDIMDNSITRRGNPCWHRKKEVGMIAINDGIFMDICVYKLIRLFTRDQPYYMNLVEIFQDIALKTIEGECLDLLMTKSSSHIDRFNKERYQTLIKWKTGYYSLYLPVAIAMCMAGITDKQSMKTAETILLEIGAFLQMQDDYLDCFGNYDVMGKVGTDIQDNKCTWLMIEALDICSEDQRKDLEKYYGNWEEDAVKKVKNIYKNLELDARFKEFEKRKYKEIVNMAETMKGRLTKDVYISLIDKINKRVK